MATKIWVNIGSCNGLLPDGNKAITWTNVDLSLDKSHDIHLRALSQEDLKIPINKTRLEIALLKLNAHLPGANELREAWKENMWKLW